MRIYCEADYDAMSRRAANLISAEVIRRPDCVLGLATGSTPIGTYKQLSVWNQRGDFSFCEVKTVNLDEYIGVAPDSKYSYQSFMRENFFEHTDIDISNTHIPNGRCADPNEECKRYDELICGLGHIDLQLLGLGRNGHIGFNEPCDYFVKPTHVVNLCQSTIDANSRFFASKNDVPKQAITMGIGCIMSARRVLLIASGSDKADAVYRAFCGPINPNCPASILQLHNDVVLVGDEKALSRLIASGMKI
ncbi:MAG: glucosamine-6-phosphate deaminase [Acutalibacteraceae bacterium]